MAEWYYMFNGQQSGPVSGSQLKSLAATGGIGPEDLVWNESMKDWVAAQRMRGLTFARTIAAPTPIQPVSMSAPIQPMTAPAPVYAPQPPAEEYAPLPEASMTAYETAPITEQAPQPLSYAQPSNEGVTPATINYLKQTRPWVMLVSILLFVLVALMAAVGVFGLLAVLAAGAIARTNTNSSGGSGPSATTVGGVMAGLGVVVVIVMLVYAVLFFVPGLLLMKYASAIKRLIASRKSKDLEAAMKAQKSFWMFIGILLLVVLALDAIMALLSVLGPGH